MRCLLVSTLVQLLLAAPFAAVGSCEARPADISTVRNLLVGIEFKEQRETLVQLGENAFPAYEVILSDPKSKATYVARILGVLCDVKADRARFVEHAVRGLAHPDSGVRGSAVILLEQIGTVKEASPVVALLSDGAKVADKPIVYSAAKTLAAIGGPREVVAMDAWLLGGSHRDDAHLRHHVKQCRDALQKRLTESRAKDKS